MAKIEDADKILIGERIRSVRKDKKLTQKEVCDALGMPQPNLSLYEKGETRPPLNFLIAFAKEYGVSVDYLVGITEK